MTGTNKVRTVNGIEKKVRCGIEKPWDQELLRFLATLKAILHIVYTTLEGRSASVKTCQHRFQMLPRQHADVFQPDFQVAQLLLQLQLRELVQHTNWEHHRVMVCVLAYGLYVPCVIQPCRHYEVYKRGRSSQYLMFPMPRYIFAQNRPDWLLCNERSLGRRDEYALHIPRMNKLPASKVCISSINRLILRWDIHL